VKLFTPARRVATEGQKPNSTDHRTKEAGIHFEKKNQREAQCPDKKESRYRQYTSGQDKEPPPSPHNPNLSRDIQKQEDNDP